MELKDKIVVVTGAARGIGQALAIAFENEGAKCVICADIDLDAAKGTASRIGGIAVKTDVSKEADIQRLIEDTERDVGPIDLFVSNAGIAIPGGVETGNDDWQRIWDINVMSQVWAARHMVPRMAARGGGYLLNTASAAGLLNQVGSAPYGVTKHASVGLSEWLAMSHADDGIKVSVLCPQAVRTDMTKGQEDHVAALDGMLEPEDAARACVETIRAETFLVLPHPKVLDYMRMKTADYDRWIGGMTKLHRQFGDWSKD